MTYNLGSREYYIYYKYLYSCLYLVKIKNENDSLAPSEYMLKQSGPSKGKKRLRFQDKTAEECIQEICFF
jgi:hypothetical protein